jgi:hypothetical protein
MILFKNYPKLYVLLGILAGFYIMSEYQIEFYLVLFSKVSNSEFIFKNDYDDGKNNNPETKSEIKTLGMKEMFLINSMI